MLKKIIALVSMILVFGCSAPASNPAGAGAKNDDLSTGAVTRQEFMDGLQCFATKTPDNALKEGATYLIYRINERTDEEWAKVPKRAYNLMLLQGKALGCP